MLIPQWWCWELQDIKIIESLHNPCSTYLLCSKYKNSILWKLIKLWFQTCFCKVINIYLMAFQVLSNLMILISTLDSILPIIISWGPKHILNLSRKWRFKSKNIWIKFLNFQNQIKKFQKNIMKLKIWKIKILIWKHLINNKLSN